MSTLILVNTVIACSTFAISLIYCVFGLLCYVVKRKYTLIGFLGPDLVQNVQFDNYANQYLSFFVVPSFFLSVKIVAWMLTSAWPVCVH
jgi:hypothetical protein